MEKFKNSNETIEVTDYPYGYKRTSAFFGVEFHPKKGFRSTFQTINPKNGRVNKIKYGVYYPYMFQFRDVNGHIKTHVENFNGSKELQKGVENFKENFDLFTTEQKIFIYGYLLTMSRQTIGGMIQWSGSKFEDLKPFFETFISSCVKGMKDSSYQFDGMTLDVEGIEKTTDPNYNPFRTTKMVSLSTLTEV